MFYILGYHDFLVVPRSFHKVLLPEFHSSMLVGHFGAKKMCSLLSEHAWWLNMLGLCKRAYHACTIC